MLEVHLTALIAPSQLDAFARTCQQLSLKCVNIELDRGLQKWQPMATWHLRASLVEALDDAERIIKQFKESGLAICRTKIEADLGSLGVPATSSKAAEFPDCYFEHHHKLLLEPTADLSKLLILCQEHGARISRNTFKHRIDGCRERFATQRHFGVGADEAVGRAAQLAEALVAAGYVVIKSVSEYCVFDNRLSLDEGWLSKGE